MAPRVIEKTDRLPPSGEGPDTVGTSPVPAPRACAAQRPERAEAELLVAASVLLADAALTARQSGAELTGALFSWRFGLQALRRPGWALGTAVACAQALTSPSGLGFGANGGLIGELARMAGSHPSPVAISNSFGFGGHDAVAVLAGT